MSPTARRARSGGGARSAGVALYALVPVEPSLEDAFLSLVGDAGDRRS
jgi:hypothetical protein